MKKSHSIQGFEALRKQRIADLSNILVQIVDFACNLGVWTLDCVFIVELLADPNLDKTIVGSADFSSNLGSLHVYPYCPPAQVCTMII
jgi:hypothetical protein